MVKRREEEHALLRTQFFSTYHIEDKGQRVLVYFGGNNEEYFTSAFPAFLRFLQEGVDRFDLSSFVIVLQQHPGARSQNIDGAQLDLWIQENGKKTKAPKIIKSLWESGEMQVVADGGLYYQTSMGPLFALSGIATIQVGHKTYEDILVRNHLCPSVTTTQDFINAILQVRSDPITEVQREDIYKSLRIRPDWFEIFKQAVGLGSECMVKRAI
jgi:hypothetical protein